MTPRHIRISIAATLCAFTVACDGATDPEDDAACQQLIGRTLIVSVRDSVTNAPIAANAELTATMGWFTVTRLQTAEPGADTLPLAVDGPGGNYTLTVRKPGYQEWTRTPVTVPLIEHGPCRGHPQTTTVEARLSPM